MVIKDFNKTYLFNKRYHYMIYMMPIFGHACSLSKKTTILTDTLKDKDIFNEANKILNETINKVCLYCVKRTYTKNGIIENYPIIMICDKNHNKIYKNKEYLAIHY